MSTTVNLGKVQVAYKGEYSPLETYTVLDRVSINGTWFECKMDGVTNIQPVVGEDSVYWMQLNNIEPGKDGFCPTAVVSKTDDTVTITLVDVNGPSVATVKDGPKGDTGEAPKIESNIDVVTLAPGSMGSATMENIDPVNNKYKLHLNIPRGDVGPEPVIPNATASTLGIVKIGSNITVSSDGTISVPAASTTKAGVVKLNNTYTSTSTTEAATANMLKVVYDKAVAAATAAQNAQSTADAATTNANGKWVATDASASTKGIVKIGDNISVASGVISVPIATTSKLGVVKIGSGLTIDASGTLTVPVASTTIFGSVKIGSNITNTSGVISVPVATASVLGVVKTGTNITNSSGTISVPNASTSVIGAVKLSSATNSTVENLAATPKAVKAAYDLANGKWTAANASTSVKGIVIVGTNINVNSGGTISVNNASTSTKGVVQLSSATNSTSETLAATPKAVHAAFNIIPSGTRMLFQQSAAPSGWTKETGSGYNNAALRTVTGNIANKTNGKAFTTCMAAGRTSTSVAGGGTVGNKSLSVAMLAAHTHTVANVPNSWKHLVDGDDVGFQGIQSFATKTSSSTGSGSAHNHSFSGTAHSHKLDLDINYIDCIIAKKA